MKNPRCLRVLPKCMLRQARIHQLDRLTTKHHLVLYGPMLTIRMHGRCLLLHRHLLCSKLEGIQGSSMHVNTTRNGKTGHMIRMTTLGLRIGDKDPKNDKPVIQLFGNVVQKNADIAEAKEGCGSHCRDCESLLRSG